MSSLKSKIYNFFIKKVIVYIISKIRKEKIMGGWKTWTAVISTILYAVFYVGFVVGDWQTAVTLILGALALLGIGGKIDKIPEKRK